MTGRRRRTANEISQKRIENTGIGQDQEGRDQDPGQENVPTTDLAGTKIGTGSRVAGTENPEAGTGSRGVGTANLEVETGNLEAVTAAETELK